MHVLILNQTFYPDIASTAQLMWDLARHLDAGGHRVTALTSRNVYGTDRVFEKSRERVGNIAIHRVGGTRFGKGSTLGKLGRLADFASFYVAAGLELRRYAGEVDVILALTSPPLVASLGTAIKALRGSLGQRVPKLVYHVMDLYPDAAVAMGMMRERSLADRLAGRLARWTFASADAVIALGRDMKERLSARYGGEDLAARTYVVPPWAQGDALTPLDKANNPLARELGLDRTFNVVYSGNLGMAHDLETMLQAAGMMKNDPATQFVFIGGGKRFDQLKAKVASEGWPHVRLMDYQDRERLNLSLNLADVHLVSQLPKFTGVVVPSKLFGIMAVGKPAVMIGPRDAEVSRIIEQSGCGRVIENGAADLLVSCLRELRADEGLRGRMGAAGRIAFEREYDRPIACRRIEEILLQAVEGRA